MIIQDTKQIAGLLGWINDQDFISYDIETTGTNVRKDQIIGFGLSNHKDAFYIPVWIFNGTELEESNLSQQDIVSILQSLRSKKLITFNGAFDLPFTKNYFGVDLLKSLWADGLLAKHTVDEEFPFKLKQIAKKLYGEDATVEQEEMALSVKSNGGQYPHEMYKCDLDIMAKYCKKDCVLTYKITMHYIEEMKKQNLVEFFFRDEVMPLYKEVTIPMEQKGIPVDVPLLESSLEEIRIDLHKLEDEIQQEIKPLLGNFIHWYLNRHYPAKKTGVFAQMYCKLNKLPLPKTRSGNYSLSKKVVESLHDGPERRFLLGEQPLSAEQVREVQMALAEKEEQRYPFNIASKDHLKRLFFQELGEKAVSFTELGNPQVNDEFLDLMASKYNWADKIRQFNKLNKIKGTYIERVLERQEDGIYYPQFFQHRTVSGRYGSDLQQLPRPIEPGKASELVIKHNNKIRTFFISGPGHVFVDADYCLHPKTELLTKEDGWVPVLEIKQNHTIWQVDQETEEGSWTKPLRIVNKDFLGKMYTFGNSRGKLSVTENHTMLWVGQFHKSRKDKSSYRQIKKSQELIPTTGCNFLQGSSKVLKDKIKKYSLDELKIATLLSADGNIVKNRDNYYRIQVSKPEKVAEIVKLLGPPNSVHKARGAQNYDPCDWYLKFSSPLLREDKSLELDNIPFSESETLLKLLATWDGYLDKNGAVVWGQINKGFVERVQAYFVSCGYEAKLSMREYNNPNHNTFYTLRIKKGNRIRLRKTDYEIEDYNGKVGCVTVPSGFILVRSGGQTFVTGNCALEPHVFSHVSGDEALRDIFRNGDDFYSTIAIQTEKIKNVSANPNDSNYLGLVDKGRRQKAKTYSLGIPYGMTPYKLQFEINVNKEEAERLVSQYLDAFPDLASWMKKSNEQAVNFGRVRSEAGRVRHLPYAKKLVKQYGLQLLDSLWLWKQYNDQPEVYKKMKKRRRELSNYLNNAKNFQIQSLATSIVNRAAIAITRFMKEHEIPGYVCAQIHDQLIVRTPLQYGEQLRIAVQDIMENNYKLSIDLKAPAALARNFKDGH